MKTKKLLSIMITIAMVAGSLPGFVLADTDIDDTEVTSETTTETTSDVDEEEGEVGEEPSVDETDVDESVDSVDTVVYEETVSYPAYNTGDTNDAEGPEIVYLDREWSNGTIVETLKSLDATPRQLEGGYSLASGWYYVPAGVQNINSRVYVFSGRTINIILADGAVLNCNDGIFVEKNAVLNIYGQINDSGVLNSSISPTTTEQSGQAGIGGNSSLDAGTINIYGGTINASGDNGAAGIGGSDNKVFEAINIYGGIITATGNNYFDIGANYSDIRGPINIYGGSTTLSPVTNGGHLAGTNNNMPSMCVFLDGVPLATSAWWMAFSDGTRSSSTVLICPCQHPNLTDGGTCAYCGYELSNSAQFVGHAMQLTGEIGLQFYVQLPSADATGYTMSFAGQGMDPNVRVGLTLDTTGKTRLTNAFYAQVNMSSIQMAERFTPTLHCPDGTTIVGTAYSAQDYILWGKSNSSINTQEQSIIQALGDYGYYAQRYLSSIHTWSMGTDYATMTTRGSTQDYPSRYAEFSEWISTHPTDRHASGRFITNDYFSSATCTLKFDNLVTLYVYLTPKDGVSIDASKINGAGGTVTRLSDGRFLITYPNIRITLLDHALHINYNDIPIAEVSPLTYVYAVLNSDSVSADGKNMVCALFSLFQLVTNPTTI